MDEGRGILALMGSGETSPTMVTLHRALAAHLEGDRDAVILETPYGFQVNRDDISARAREYFRKSVGLTTMVAPDADATAGDLPGGADRIRDLVRRAGWVFSGPGSPSYALRRWHTQRLGEILCERVARGHGVTVMASAAACTVGFAALPVYEIYKAGHPPVWLDGLDLLGALGLPVAVIPHYNNTEGGTHDTRFCYLGETRLSTLERELPDHTAVLGIDEHTAVVIDHAASLARVWGRGVMTIRRKGDSLVVPRGTSLTLDQLRELVGGRRPGTPVPAPRQATDDHGVAGLEASDTPATLQEAVAASETRFSAARNNHDAPAMAEVIVELESVITAWQADMEEDQGGEWARTVLHGMIRLLARHAGRGMAEPEHTLARILGPLLDLRSRMRVDGAWDLADELRDALAAGGVRLHDTPEGTNWRWQDTDATTPSAHSHE
jgi:hypothetical protein